MCVVVMLGNEEPREHEHDCGHCCACEVPADDVCDRCDVGTTLAARYPSLQLSPSQALARLYLALHQIAIGG